jgi:hypothetical protein
MEEIHTAEVGGSSPLAPTLAPTRCQHYNVCPVQWLYRLSDRLSGRSARCGIEIAGAESTGVE